MAEDMGRTNRGKPIWNSKRAGASLLFCLCLCACLGRKSFAASPYISEFMANNVNTLTDDFGTKPDWIEIHNPDSAAVNLLGYYLTDDKSKPQKWAFPSYNLSANARLVVFASDRNLTDPTLPHKLHTNFKLSESGEYLALTRLEPTGAITVLTQFDPFPAQFRDVSYGTPSSGAAPFYLNTPTPGKPTRLQKRFWDRSSIIQPRRRRVHLEMRAAPTL